VTTSEAPQPADPAAAAATAPAATYDEVTAVRGRSQWEIFWKRFRRHKLGMIGAIGLLVITLAAIFGPIISPYEFDSPDLTNLNAEPSRSHPFGTGELGEDQLTRVLLAGRVSLQVGLFTALVATAIGTVLGLMAGFIGRFTDTSISRLTDLFLAAPALPILIVVSLTFESIGLLEIVLVLALLSWMPLTRIVRANALSLKEREFVQAARAMGAKRSRILFRHLLPNSVAEIVVFATLLVAVSIITEATLSFLGLGINPARDPSWGNLLSTQSENILAGQYWWLTVFPGLFIITTVLFVNFVGDALRDALDPHGVTFEAKE
jgi:peptide/nickel transport system permease protein